MRDPLPVVRIRPWTCFDETGRSEGRSVVIYWLGLIFEIAFGRPSHDLPDLPAGDEPTGEPNTGMSTVPPVDMSVTARPDLLRSGQSTIHGSGA